MKYLLPPALLAVAATVLASIVPLSAADTLLNLENPGFENGLAGWTSDPPGSLAFQALPEAAFLGKTGLRVTGARAARFSLSSSMLPVTAGKSYQVIFWGGGGGKPEQPGDGVSVNMIFKNAAGKILKPAMAKVRKWPGVKAKGDTYANVYTLAAAAPEGAATLNLQLSCDGKVIVGSMDIDDFQVFEMSDESAPVVPPGGAHPIPPFDPARVQALEAEVAADPHRGKPVPKIVLKLDDFGAAQGKVHPKWLKVANFCRERGVKVNFGIIATRMVEDCPEFVKWTQEQHAAGRIEFWNHGWDHAERKEGEKRIQEFCGETLEYQTQHLLDVQKLAREKLGFPLPAFGAPFNATDDNTIKALAADPDTKVWMYGKPGPESGKIVLERSAVSIESPSMIPNYADFLEGYAHNRGADYFVMQGHAAAWNDERWDQFVKIVDFLIAQKADFVFASEFAAPATAAK